MPQVRPGCSLFLKAFVRMSFSLSSTKDPWFTWAWIFAIFFTTSCVSGLLKLNSAHKDDVDLLASIQFLVLSSKFAYGISLPALIASSISFCHIGIFLAYPDDPMVCGCTFLFACSLLCLLNNLAASVLFFSTKVAQSSGVIMPHLRNGLRPCFTYCIFNSLFQSLKHLFAVFMTHFLTSDSVPLGTLNHIIQFSQM